MKKSVNVALFLLLVLTMQGQIKLGDLLSKPLETLGQTGLGLDKVFNLFEEKGPISTNFDDAVYETAAMDNYEPDRSQYRPLYMQPTDSNGGFRLKSGLYSMKVRSFCLKAGTYGPSRGDGHLYAPLKGKKADFVKTILTRYGNKPDFPQQKIQVLLWAVVAGANMNNLGQEHLLTLAQLFTTEELLKYRGKDWLNGLTDRQISAFTQNIRGQIPPQLQTVLRANGNLRQLLQQNSTFQQLESVAVLAGIAPASDMVRPVTRGRWSYHPDGYFVRYFPEGYAQTQVDVYVPSAGNVDADKKGKLLAVRHDAGAEKQVVFTPAGTVAVPANRSSQRIGISPVPIDPCGTSSNWQDLSQSWKTKALEMMLTLKGKSTIRNHGITCAYARIYQQNPGKFKWAGLAALVSGKIGQRQDEFAWGTGLKDDIFSGNKAVFDDLYWQHLAYSEKGMAEIERLYCNKKITWEVYNAWQKIDVGDVWGGNLDLLYHEQKNILQPALYAGVTKVFFWTMIDSEVGKLIQGENILVSPVPGDDSEFPGKNISDFEQRWGWIKAVVMPHWQVFETDPTNAAELRAALQKVCPGCCSGQ